MTSVEETLGPLLLKEDTTPNLANDSKLSNASGVGASVNIESVDGELGVRESENFNL